MHKDYCIAQWIHAIICIERLLPTHGNGTGAPLCGTPVPLSIVQSDDSVCHLFADPLVERFGAAEGNAEIFGHAAQAHGDGGTHHAADGGFQKRPPAQQVDAEAPAEAVARAR